MPSERQLTAEQACAEIARLQISRRIDKVIVHHTWRPAAADYRGSTTVRGIRDYHVRVRGWSDCGYHCEIAPNGDVWFCRPFARSGAHCQGQNSRSIGISYIADFDARDPATYAGLAAGQRVVAALCERFGLDTEDVYFHSDFSAKTCPGTLMKLADYRKAVSRFMNGGLKVVLLPGSEVITCRPEIEEGICRADLRSLTESLGYEVIANHLGTQGKIYLRKVQN